MGFSVLVEMLNLQAKKKESVVGGGSGSGSGVGVGGSGSGGGGSLPLPDPAVIALSDRRLCMAFTRPEHPHLFAGQVGRKPRGNTANDQNGKPHIEEVHQVHIYRIGTHHKTAASGMVTTPKRIWIQHNKAANENPTPILTRVCSTP